jgi:hypothetical protein
MASPMVGVPLPTPVAPTTIDGPPKCPLRGAPAAAASPTSRPDSAGADGFIPARDEGDWRVVQSAQRDGVALELLWPAPSFLPGEGISPRARVRNLGNVPLKVRTPYLGLLNDHGQRPMQGFPWFLQENLYASAPRIDPSLVRLNPGESATQSIVLRVPVGSDLDNGPWKFQVNAGFGPETVQEGNLRTPGTWTSIRLPDVPLPVILPTARQELRSTFWADHQQWCMRVTDGEGRPPMAPLQAWAFVNHYGGSGSFGPLGLDTNGVWAAYWDPAGRQPRRIHAWIAGSGYASVEIRGFEPFS